MASNTSPSRTGFAILAGLRWLTDPVTRTLREGRHIDSNRVRGQALQDLKASLKAKKAA